MKTITPDQLRTLWNGYFEARGHTPHPSDSLVPENDPTLLFTGAGMNQFKEMFVGKGNLPFKRAATIQKCFRQGDLENVGRTPRHLTFFEMMGHFSFGDYFKKDAIPWAWAFLTDELRIPKDKLYVSVYEDDEEALELWRGLGVEESHIGRFDAKENFWPADAPAKGPNGPCGPCSEIFYDYGKEREIGDGGPEAWDSGRFVEIWNTVFTQYNRRGVNELDPLPQRNIDCGAGFERVVAVLEGQYSPFGTSLFRGILEAVAKLADTTYPFDPAGGLPAGENPRRMRRISEHVRASCMLAADGVRPGNEGRGYVMRRVLRRAIRDGIQLGIEKPFLGALVDPVLESMATAYPALAEGRTTLISVLENEERRFRETFNTGLKYLEQEVAKLEGGKTLSGDAAFKLYDTYGFPLDLAQAILEELGIDVDEAGFEAAMEAQRQRARAGSKIASEIFVGGPLTELKSQKVGETVFEGHTFPGLEGAGHIVGLIHDGALAETAPEGSEVTLVLDRTPFYGESGGQAGDEGIIEGDGFVVEVTGTQKTEGYHLHEGRVRSGTVTSGASVTARVDASRRDAIRRNHTATHLLHKVLKDVLGEHVQQEGSMVEADRLRFDFRHDKAVSQDEIVEIERRVNTWVLANEAASTEVMDLDAAKASGAVAMFGEKYAGTVRVLDVPGPTEVGTSRELCGGTHVLRTGDIGSFRITVETSVAAGIRRLEAVTGEGAVSAFTTDRRVLRDLSSRLKARPEELGERLAAMQDEIKTLKKAIDTARKEAALGQVASLAKQAEDLGGRQTVLASLEGVDAKALKGVWEALAKDGVEVALLIGEQGGKAPVLAAATPAAVEAGADAKALLQAATSVLGGGGGGRPSMAQGQGQQRGKITEALAAVRASLGGS